MCNYAVVGLLQAYLRYTFISSACVASHPGELCDVLNKNRRCYCVYNYLGARLFSIDVVTVLLQTCMATDYRSELLLGLLICANFELRPWRPSCGLGDTILSHLLNGHGLLMLADLATDYISNRVSYQGLIWLRFHRMGSTIVI